MTHSMTGFARTQQTHNWGQITCEIKSVNHRYLEAHFKLPDALKNQENTLRDRLKKTLNRGKCEITFTLHTQKNDHTLSINNALVKQLSKLTSDITAITQDIVQHITPVNPLDILKWPGVIQTIQLDEKAIQTASIDTFNEALNLLIEHRQREGQALNLFIQERIRNVETNIEKVTTLFPTIINHYQEKLRTKLNELKTDVDETRFHQEVIYTAQKYDITEELDRLTAHNQELKNILNSNGAKGRRLDFLMQELNREANTLTSKSISIDTTNIAVDLKVQIEQMREQIQNIE